ncbi:MAG: TonB-dependent receptor [Acidobacteria bacterium]|nr:TonB-dependent receptor [Acidobacteriota bacterium]
MFVPSFMKEEQSLLARRLFPCLLAAICALLVATSSAFAQGSRGTISGEVTDPTGAVVPGATVRLIKSDNKQEVRSVTTNDQGVYQFLEIEAGVYEIVITAQGFTETRLTEAALEPNRALRLDARLGVGGASEEVTVTTSQEILDRETPTLGTSVEGRRVQGLPLNGRNILDLALGQPGVIASAAGGGIRVNGARNVENNITLDGANNNEIAVGGATGAQPRPDAVQEFRLLTSNYEAEFGRNTGSIITVVTRGGTNDFHGNLRAFWRPTVLSAARFFDQNEATDRPRPGTINDFRRRFERKEFGGNFGGPIWLPRFGEGGKSIWKGKDKSFFFVDYEGRRQLIGDTRTLSNLPTAEERSGLFTRRAANATALPVRLLDPATGLPFPIVSGTFAPGQTIQQQIPASRFSPITQFYLGFLPIPGPTGSATVGANQVTNFDILTARIDHLVNDSQNLNFTFNYFDQVDQSPFAFGGASVPGFGALNLRTTLNIVARHAWSFSPTLVNSFLASYARNDQPGVSPINTTTPAEIGFQANFVANAGVAGPPFISLNERGITLGNSIQGPQSRVSENFQIQNSLSWAKGDHRFKFGFDGTKYKQDQLFLFINQGIITYSGNFGGNTTNNDFADFLIGNSPIALQFGANGERDFRQTAGALFAQDSWRVRNNLTLSLGVRYEYNSPLTDAANRVAYYRRGSTSTLLTSGQLRAEGRPILVPTGGRAPNGLVYVGDPDSVLGGTVPDGGVKKDWNNFAPRVGFALSLGDRTGGVLRTLLGSNDTVIRGGFGVTYGAIIGDTALQQLTAPGFNGTNSFFFPGSGTLADPFAPDPFPAFRGNQGQIVNPFGASSFFVTAPLTQFSRAIDPNIRTPYTYQYNLTVERAFANDYVASIAYVGNRGKKLYALEQVNPALGTFFPFDASDPRRTLVPTPTNANSRRANNDVRLGISQMVSAGNSYYDSLQAQIQRRYVNGLLFQVAYTFSKSISDSDQLRDTLDLIDRRFGKSLSANDTPHRFVGSFIYDLPFFKSGNGFARTVLGGWSIGGIYSAQSGTPFSVGNPFDTVGTGGGVLSLADLGAPFTHVDPRASDNRAFNANAFAAFGAPDAAGNFTAIRRGSSSFNQFRLKNGQNNLDAILSKNTKITETTSLELRFEAFNALNHTQFTTVNLNLSSASFGRFTDARESRVIQLGARFQF